MADSLIRFVFVAMLFGVICFWLYSLHCERVEGAGASLAELDRLRDEVARLREDNVVLARVLGSMGGEKQVNQSVGSVVGVSAALRIIEADARGEIPRGYSGFVSRGVGNGE